MKTRGVRRKHSLLAWRCLFLCLALIVALCWPLVASAQDGEDPVASPEAPAALGPFSGGAGVIMSLVKADVDGLLRILLRHGRERGAVDDKAGVVLCTSWQQVLDILEKRPR